MSQETIKILDDLARRFGIIIDCNNQNVISYFQDFMQRFIRYKLIINSVGLSFSIIWIVAFILIFVKQKNISRLLSNESIEITFYIIVSVISVLVIIMLFECSIDIVKCLTIPEKLIVEMIKNMNG